MNKRTTTILAAQASLAGAALTVALLDLGLLIAGWIDGEQARYGAETLTKCWVALALWVVVIILILSPRGGRR